MFNERKIVLLLFPKIYISVKALNHVSNFNKGSVRADSDSISQLIPMPLFLEKYWTQGFFHVNFSHPFQDILLLYAEAQKTKARTCQPQSFSLLGEIVQGRLSSFKIGNIFYGEKKWNQIFQILDSSSRKKKTLAHNPIVTLSDFVN